MVSLGGNGQLPISGTAKLYFWHSKSTHLLEAGVNFVYRFSKK